MSRSSKLNEVSNTLFTVVYIFINSTIGFMKTKAVRQEDPMGCGVACVVFLLGKTYRQTLKLFLNSETKASTTGFVSKELVKVLGNDYRVGFAKRNKSKIYMDGSIVFMRRGKKYTHGHFVARLNGRWMNPYINLPEYPIQAGFQKRLPEQPAFVIFQLKTST